MTAPCALVVLAAAIASVELPPAPPSTRNVAVPVVPPTLTEFTLALPSSSTV